MRPVPYTYGDPFASFVRYQIAETCLWESLPELRLLDDLDERFMEVESEILIRGHMPINWVSTAIT
jgi:hypothetical protein